MRMLHNMRIVELAEELIWFGIECKGQSPNQGHSPKSFYFACGGAEPRLTSGGEAAAEKLK
jgi:hypothetical protein